MKQDLNIKTDSELFERRERPGRDGSQVSVIHLRAALVKKHLHTSVHLRSSMFILVLNGTAQIEINFRKHHARSGHLILLSFGHFFTTHHLSEDLELLVLYVSKNYIDQMFSSEMIYKRAKFGVKMHQLPLLLLSREEESLVQSRLLAVQEAVSNKTHSYHQEIILNTLHGFFLDLSHIIEMKERKVAPKKQNRDELYFQDFLELLVSHYKSRHKVDFYAAQLHITTHYLTQIVKRLSGQTASDLIFQLLYSEARLLLQSDRSIQQIAAELHFSDQSAFGKFFKRKSGLSPRDFRNEINRKSPA